MLKVVRSMENNNALICTAILTSFYEETKKSNITLLIPFVLYIIYNNPSITDDEIITKMEEEYAFYKLPHAILRLIINKMLSDNIIKKDHGSYIVIESNEIIQKVNNFKDKLEISKKETDDVLNSLQKYLKEKHGKNEDIQSCKNYLSKFLWENGYILYEDIETNIESRKKSGNLSYYIGKFIEYHRGENDTIFRYLINIIEGSLLANALYINIESCDENLSKVEFYLDTTFLLRALNFKTNRENESAKELIELLKAQGAKLYCFKHTYSEIENILESFISKKDIPNERTLENLIIKQYSPSELQIILTQLENMLKNIGIKVVDTPEYVKEKHKYVIAEKDLYKKIKESYEDKNVSRKTIENDVKSISSVMLIRENKKMRVLEKCKAIFITTNDKLRSVANEFLDLDEQLKISPVISDIDITAIVWLKSLSLNKNIPEIMLIENARASMELTPKMKRKLKECVENLNSSLISSASVYSLIYSEYFAEKIMESTGGEVQNVDSNLLLNQYTEAITDSKIYKEQIEILQKKLAEEQEINKKYERETRKEYELKAQKMKNRIEFFEKFIQFAIGLGLLYAICMGNDQHIIVRGIGLVFGIYSEVTLLFKLNIIDMYEFICKKINSFLFRKIDELYHQKIKDRINKISK